MHFDRPAAQLDLWQELPQPQAYELRASSRARRLSVRVFHTGRVEIVVPRTTSRRTVARFLDAHRKWIDRKRAAALANMRPAERFPPAEIRLAAVSDRWRLHVAGGRGTLRARAAHGVLQIKGEAGSAQAIRRELRAWLVRESERHLGALLQALSIDGRFRYRRLAVRRQRTRWGSCSTRGTVSLNCCLMFQRPEVVRYLVIHELAHTRHMNHSPRFWDCVATLCPGYQALDRELLDGWRNVPAWVFDHE
jgi:predicted metal-dependent hydrolase